MGLSPETYLLFWIAKRLTQQPSEGICICTGENSDKVLPVQIDICLDFLSDTDCFTDACLRQELCPKVGDGRHQAAV